MRRLLSIAAVGAVLCGQAGAMERADLEQRLRAGLENLGLNYIPDNSLCSLNAIHVPEGVDEGQQPAGEPLHRGKCPPRSVLGEDEHRQSGAHHRPLVRRISLTC